MHHAIPRGTALCGATLRSPEIKSCRIILCVIQREYMYLYIVENSCGLLGFKCFQRLNMQFIHGKSFWKFSCAFYKEILHFLNPNTALRDKRNNWTKWWIFTWYPGVRFMSSFANILWMLVLHALLYKGNKCNQTANWCSVITVSHWMSPEIHFTINILLINDTHMLECISEINSICADRNQFPEMSRMRCVYCDTCAALTHTTCQIYDRKMRELLWLNLHPNVFSV